MTDKVSCTAYYIKDAQIQLTAGAFFIGLRGRGGVKGITLRFDEKRARSLRLASDMEKRLGAVDFNRDEFEELVAAKRLRAQVITVLDTLYEYDIDLTGHFEALQVIRAPECKG